MIFVEISTTQIPSKIDSKVDFSPTFGFQWFGTYVERFSDSYEIFWDASLDVRVPRSQI